jgi:molybdate transport system substrate-binding protein
MTVMGLLFAVACSSSPAAPSHQITVAAAASLTQVFQRIAADFEKVHPGDGVRFTFSSSNGLAIQIQQGAPVDVFASAAPRWLDLLSKDPGVIARATFARNRLIVIVPRDNPAHIGRLADLARRDVRLVLAAPGVPAGDYARQSLTKAGLRAALRNVVSNEQDVESVVAKVVSGDADAGIVYATDLTTNVSSLVRAIEVPSAANVVAVYQLGIIRGTKAASAARAFVDYVLGSGQATLRAAGFEAAS